MMPTRRGRRLLRAGALAALLGAALAAGCNNSARQPEIKPAEVVVTTPVGDEVMDYQDFTGRLDALESVDIRARVSGYVKEAPFHEGDVVREGDLLFLIDPQPYQADLNQAEANLRLAQAERGLQIKNAERAAQLVARNAMSREDYETTLAARDKAAASVESARAALDRAKLYLSYTRVTAPFSGRISRRYVDPGNLVNADNTLLTSLVSEDPLYAYFDVDERTFLDLEKEISPDQAPGPTGTPGASHPAEPLGPLAALARPPALPAVSPPAPQGSLPVLMRLANESKYERVGVVNFIDNRVNATTGTVRMRGLFANPYRLLKPGMFVRIRLPVGKPYRALLIPAEAVLSDQGRKYVFVVNASNEVEYRTVELGQAIEGLRVIKQGLAEGDRVIVKGTQRVRPKAKVVARAEKPPARPPSPLGAWFRSRKAGDKTAAR